MIRLLLYLTPEAAQLVLAARGRNRPLRHSEALEWAYKLESFDPLRSPERRLLFGQYRRLIDGQHRTAAIAYMPLYRPEYPGCWMLAQFSLSHHRINNRPCSRAVKTEGWALCIINS